MGTFVSRSSLVTVPTECIALSVREQLLIVEAIKAVRVRLPFPLLGLDTDNDIVFMNDTVWDCCKEYCPASLVFLPRGVLIVARQNTIVCVKSCLFARTIRRG